MKNCPIVDSRPLPKVANACAPWSKPEQERCTYECKNRRFLCRGKKSRVRVRGNKRSESRNTDHRARRSEAAQLLAFSFARDLRELRLAGGMWGVCEADAPLFKPAVCFWVSLIRLVNSASICGVTHLSHFSRINCSVKAVRLSSISIASVMSVTFNRSVSRR